MVINGYSKEININDQHDQINDSSKTESTDIKETKVTGISDNLGGYHVKSLNDYIGSDNPPHNISAQPNPNPDIKSEGKLLPPTGRYKSNSFQMTAFIVGLIILIVLALFIHKLEHKTPTKSNDSSNGSLTQDLKSIPRSSGSSTNQSKNPFNSGSITQESNYCSNPINAQENC